MAGAVQRDQPDARRPGRDVPEVRQPGVPQQPVVQHHGPAERIAVLRDTASDTVVRQGRALHVFSSSWVRSEILVARPSRKMASLSSNQPRPCQVSSAVNSASNGCPPADSRDQARR
ncbi:hypothetical protein GA0115255_110706 [Streptomyces sp. Ncost-T6T-2b]|nr:hypothetical protein GA0115255_110706 [Streptomyces sp. Ncost-T6T-2b]